MASEPSSSSEADTNASSLKHDLRTPLNHIIGYSEMLIEERGGVDDPLDLLSDLRKVHAAGRRLLGVVHDLFDESIPEPERLDESRIHHEVRTPLNQIIGYTELLQEEAPEKEADLVEDLGKIHGAAHRLLELVLDHFGDGRFRVTDAERVDQGGSATFRARSAQAEGKGDEGGAGGWLLVVDDDRDNREMLARRLQRLGYEVTTATHGREALEQVRERPVDLLLLDIVMPEMDGYAVLEHLRDNPPSAFLPVIVLSASDDSERVARCIEMGAEDYLPKPFDPLLLQARIESSLEKKRLRDREAAYLRTIQQEKRRADDLLRVILPAKVAAELKNKGRVRPRRVDPVAVLFTDIVGFTGYCEKRDPETVHRDLQALVETMEQVVSGHGLEKIKTIGDAFMAAAGLITQSEDPVRDAVACGLEMIEAVNLLPTPWHLRVGVHEGPVVAGVVGQQKYQYDIWGDTVNVAARMESQAPPGSVCVNAATWEKVRDDVIGRSLGEREIKGKGVIEVFEIERLREA